MDWTGLSKCIGKIFAGRTIRLEEMIRELLMIDPERAKAMSQPMASVDFTNVNKRMSFPGRFAGRNAHF
jgi:hypothetical protein